MGRPEKKARKGRRAYLDDFYRDAAGQYVYRGKMYAYRTQTPPRRRALAQLWLLGGGGLLALVANGVLPVPAMLNCPYVILPYAAGLCAAASVCWALGRLAAAGDPLREYVYQQTVQQLPLRGRLAALFCALAAAGQLVYLLRSGTGGHAAASAAFLLLQLGAAAAFWTVKVKIFVLEWSTDSEKSQ